MWIPGAQGQYLTFMLYLKLHHCFELPLRAPAAIAAFLCNVKQKSPGCVIQFVGSVPDSSESGESQTIVDLVQSSYGVLGMETLFSTFLVAYAQTSVHSSAIVAILDLIAILREIAVQV